MRFIFISPLFAFHLSKIPLGQYNFCVSLRSIHDPLDIVCHLRFGHRHICVSGGTIRCICGLTESIAFHNWGGDNADSCHLKWNGSFAFRHLKWRGHLRSMGRPSNGPSVSYAFQFHIRSVTIAFHSLLRHIRLRYYCVSFSVICVSSPRQIRFNCVSSSGGALVKR